MIVGLASTYARGRRKVGSALIRASHFLRRKISLLIRFVESDLVSMGWDLIGRKSVIRCLPRSLR